MAGNEGDCDLVGWSGLPSGDRVTFRGVQKYGGLQSSLQMDVFAALRSS